MQLREREETLPGRRLRASSSSVMAILAALVVFIGLALRIWALGRHAINSDEAVVGLMAHEILHGHFSAFYWGQDYGGGEPYFVALVFAIAGQSTFSLGLSAVVLDGVAALLLWRVARRALSVRTGWVVALLFWVWPETYVWQSTIEYGFRWFALDMGLVASLVMLRLADGAIRHRRAELALGGLCLGAGWWATPEIAYFALPIALYFAWGALRRRFRISLAEVLVIVVAVLVGAAPWIVANVHSGLASLNAGVQPDPGILHHWKVLVVHTVPMVLGLQLRLSGRWLVGPVLGNLGEYLALLGGAIVCVRFVRKEEHLFLVAYALTAPVVYGLSPFTWYWQDGRYAIFLAPLAAMLVVAMLNELVHRWPAIAPSSAGERAIGAGALLAVALVLTFGAASQLEPYRPNGVVASGSQSWTSWRANPSSGFSALASSLRARGVTRLYAGYWVAYSLTFASGGSVIATDISYVRSAAYYADVAHSRDAAWLFMNPAHYRLAVSLTGVSLNDPSCAGKTDRCLVARTFEAYLHGRHDPYRSFELGAFTVVEPRRPVSPVRLSEVLGLRAPFRLGQPALAG